VVTLVELFRIVGNKFGDAGARAFAAALETNKALTTLDLSGKFLCLILLILLDWQ